MARPSDEQQQQALAGLLGLGSHSARKSHYPELVARLDELVEEGRTQLVLDLAGVSFVDASALGVLLRTRRRVEAQQGSLRVVHEGNAYVERLLDLTGLRRLFD